MVDNEIQGLIPPPDMDSLPIQAQPEASSNDEKLKEATQSFEGMFLGQMLNMMRPKGDAESGGWFAEGPEQDMYSQMLYSEIGNLMAKERNGIGLSNFLYQQFTGNPSDGENSEAP